MWVFGVVFVVVVGLLAGWFFVSRRSGEAPEVSTLPVNKPVSASPSAQKASTESAVKENGVAVAIKDFKYSPATITVKKGTKVTWTNEDTIKHNVARDGAEGPKGALLGKGESFSFTFDKAGTYAYHCDPHPNMKATVVVTE